MADRRETGPEANEGAGRGGRATLIEQAEGMICPRCGHGTLSTREGEDTIGVGTDAVRARLLALACDWCGEHFYAPEASAALDAAIRRVLDGDVAGLPIVGRVYGAS